MQFSNAHSQAPDFIAQGGETLGTRLNRHTIKSACGIHCYGNTYFLSQKPPHWAVHHWYKNHSKVNPQVISDHYSKVIFSLGLGVDSNHWTPARSIVRGIPESFCQYKPQCYEKRQSPAQNIGKIDKIFRILCGAVYQQKIEIYC